MRHEHPLVPVIRSWLAGGVMLAGLLAAARWPELGLVLLASGFGWWKGCACCGAACGICTTTFKNQYQIVVRNITGGSGCTCTDYNGTWTVTQTTVLTPNWATGDCYASYVINPCLCYQSGSADTSADGKLAVNLLAFAIMTGAHGGLGQVQFLHNTAGTDCHTPNSQTNVMAWSSDLSFTTDCSNYSSVAISLISDISECTHGAPDTVLVTAI